MPPGSAIPSNRAAILTPSPSKSPSGCLHHIAKMNSDAKLNLLFRDEAPVAPRNAALDFQRTTHGVHNAGELD